MQSATMCDGVWDKSSLDKHVEPLAVDVRNSLFRMKCAFKSRRCDISIAILVLMLSLGINSVTMGQVIAPPRQIGFQRIEMPVANPSPIPRKFIVHGVRGLIQNELNVVAELCNLMPDESQALVDVAENEWMNRLGPEIEKRLNPHVHGTVDLDGQVERAMSDWVRATLTPENFAKYSSELEERLEFRKQAVIAETLIWMQGKLQLSNPQIERVRTVLEDKWKERWFRSIEGVFENETLLPEIHRSWVEDILTTSQKSALSTRTPYMNSPRQPFDYPELDVREPFKMGAFVGRRDESVSAADDNEKISPTGSE